MSDFEVDPPMFKQISDLVEWLAEYQLSPGADLGWEAALLERVSGGLVKRRDSGEVIEYSADRLLDLLWNVIQILNREQPRDAVHQIEELLDGLSL